MASKSAVKVVRLKHNQLVGLSEQYEDVTEQERRDSNDEKTRRSKRPDQVLYRPGPRRQMKKTPEDGHSPEDPQVVAPCLDSVVEKFAECDIKEGTPAEREQRLRSKDKKPGIALYQPRPKSGRASVEADVENKQRSRQKSEEKMKPKEEAGRKAAKERKSVKGPRNQKPTIQSKPSRESNDSFEVPENGLEWDYQVDIDSSRHHLEDDFDVELGLIGGALSPAHEEPSRPLRDPSPDDSQSFQPGHFQGMVITNSRFDGEEDKKSRPSKGRKPKGSRGRAEEEKRGRGSTDQLQGNNSAKDLKNQNNMQSHHGGLLHLPAGTSLTQSSSSQPMPVPARGRGRSRGRGSHRTLYDPNNPHKHQNTQPLSFHDPYEHTGSPDSPYSPQSHHGYPPRFPHDHWYTQQEYTMTGSPQAEGHKQVIHHQEGGHLPDDTYTRDPYYHSGYEQEAPSSAGRLSKAQTILREVAPRESQLCNLVSRRMAGAEGFARMMAIRKEVQDLYSQVVLLDPDLCNHQNVEQLLWKNAFYQIIELLRQQLEDDSEDGPPVKESLLQLIEDGTAFYQKLLADLQSVYKFNLEDFLDQNHLPSENLNRKVKLALLSTQRTLICLGDIARYRELTNHTTNYGRSRSWYMKAQQIAPKNGRPYNQLAILALYTRRKLDAVYYYIRSLAASNPFLTARESLMSLFDEARRKAEAAEKRRREEKAEHRNRRQLLKKQDAQYGTEHRLEVWHSPDGSTSLEGNSEDEEELDKLSMIELNRHFILSFLNVHGKLFTKTGMECFLDMRHQMLQELIRLLSFSPIPVGNTRLLQLMAINMFAVDNATPKEVSVESGCRALVQEQAVQLGLDMFACLMNRSIVLFHEHKRSGSCQILSEDLHQLIASIKVWADWMTCHEHLWNPPPAPVDPAFSLGLDVWQSIATFCNVLQDLQISHVKLYNTMREGCEAVILEEDVLMQGFVPLLTLPQMQTYVHSFTEKDVAKDCLRVIKLTTFGDYLCGIACPVLTYNVLTKSYESFVATCADEGEEKVQQRTSVTSEEDDVVIESSSASEDSDEGTEHIRHLKKRKQELQRKMKEKDKYQKTIDAALKSNQRPLVIDVTPVNLVPDTNCFISHLDELQTILSTSRYTLVVPLIVITELDGLAKGQRDGRSDSRDHVQQLPGHASRAVAFLEEEFDARNSYLKSITSKGTFMNTISFRSEESAADKGNNDDIILSCCLHQIKDLARDFMPDKDQEGPITLQRDVVLLTDDRNLHLKAHMRNVPVRNVNNFMRWAKIS